MNVFLYTLYIALVVPLIGFMMFIPSCIVLCFSTISLMGVKLFSLAASCVYKFVLVVLLIPIAYKGSVSIPQGPCIVIANHASSLDIFLIGHLLGSRPHTWLAKYELWNYPVLSSILDKCALPVYKPESHSKQSIVALANKKLQEGSSVVLFPEGGRYNDGTIHPFKSGFAVLAHATKCPVVPVYLEGAGAVLPPGSYLPSYSPVTITVGEPFLCDEGESIDEFKQRVFSWYSNMSTTHSYARYVSRNF